MLDSIDERLESELIRIVREQECPLNLDEIFSCLYDRRDRLSDLVAVNKETIMEKRKVRRSLDRSVHLGLLETSWKNDQVYYMANATEIVSRNSVFRLAVIRDKGWLPFSAKTTSFQSHQHGQDNLLAGFCLIALGVISAGIVFLVFT